MIGELLKKINDGPVIVCYKRKEGVNSESFVGHCVLAYDVVPYKPDINDNSLKPLLDSFKYNESTDELSMIKVYDPVDVNGNDKYNIIVKTVNKGTENESYIWNIKAYSEYMQTAGDKKIMMVTDNLNLINMYDCFDEWNIDKNEILRNLSSSLNISAPDISSENTLFLFPLIRPVIYFSLASMNLMLLLFLLNTII